MANRFDKEAVKQFMEYEKGSGDGTLEHIQWQAAVRAFWLHEVARAVWGDDHPNLKYAWSYDDLIDSIRELKTPTAEALAAAKSQAAQREAEVFDIKLAIGANPAGELWDHDALVKRVQELRRIAEQGAA